MELCARLGCSAVPVAHARLRMWSLFFPPLVAVSSQVVQGLGIADIPPHRKHAMRRAMHHVQKENDRCSRMLQGDPVLADAPWDRVEYETVEKLTAPWGDEPLQVCVRATLATLMHRIPHR